MADKEGGESVLPSQDELVQAAQSEISQVMNNVMGSMSNKDNASGEMSDFLKQHLSYDTISSGSGHAHVEYVEPMADPYNKAIKYLENHNILQLFQVNCKFLWYWSKKAAI